MTSPARQGTPTSGGAFAGDFSCTMPASIAAGDLLLAFISASNVSDRVAIDRSLSGQGWMLVGRGTQGSVVTLFVYAKIATGSDALKIGVSPNTGVASSYMIYRITGHGSAVSVAFAGATTTANADPPNCSQSGSAQDALAIAVFAPSASTLATVAPSGYGTLTTRNNAFGCSLSAAEKALTSVTAEDPGAFTSASATYVVATVTVWSTAIATAMRASQVVVETLASNDDLVIAADSPQLFFMG